MSAARQTVLILSTNSAFARELAAHWPADSQPEFTVLEGKLFCNAGHYDLAIADVSSPASHFELKPLLAATAKPAILIHADSDRPFSHTQGHVTELRGQDGLWPVVAGLLGGEILRRLHADSRAHHAETENAQAQVEATLGRYMVEMRHNVNNALTTVLGNAELLTLEPGLPAPIQAQADSIRNMALRLNEVFQRFSSIEKELSVGARESGKTPLKSRAATAGR